MLGTEQSFPGEVTEGLRRRPHCPGPRALQRKGQQTAKAEMGQADVLEGQTEKVCWRSKGPRSSSEQGVARQQIHPGHGGGGQEGPAEEERQLWEEEGEQGC
jgi:hypothetical protein